MYGPYFFWRDDIPETELVPIDPRARLPGDLLALYDARGRKETPLWLHVIVSHGDPLHDRAAFERALDLPPWPDAAG